MNEHAVVIAGGGPTGLMLAAELAIAGVDAVIVARRATQELDGSRAGGLYARTLEVLDQRGVAERFVAAGQKHPAIAWAQTALDITDFPTRHNYTLALWQRDFERILAGWALDELGAPIRRDCDVLGFTQHDDGVRVDVSDGSVLRAQYLVGCDGGRSAVRKSAGIAFPGLDASTSWMIAEVEMDEEPEFGFRNDDTGTHAIGRRAEGEPIRIVLTEREVAHVGEPEIDELRAALVGIYGTDFGLRRATWISRFTDMSRQAAEYRRGRVLLAGDAAHIHPPHGGQGLNTGVQDAVNLGWKLAQLVNNEAPDALLDTYHAERHPVGARVLHNTMAAVALVTPDDRHQALRETMQELLRTDEARRRIAGELSALDIHYDLGGDHPLVGRRMPDLDITTAGGPTRVYDLLHDAQPVHLDFRAGASYDGAWELPVIGAVTPPTTVQIRPDGYVAAVEVNPV